jgi:glycosyltransferase involved in cell wall biosynthesis
MIFVKDMRLLGLFYYYLPTFSGAAIQFHRHAREFIRHGHEVIIVTPKRSRQLKEETIDGVKVIRVPVLGKCILLCQISFTFSASLELIRRRNAFDITQNFFHWPFATLPVWITKILSKKVVYQMTLLGDEPSNILRRKGAVLSKFGLSLVDGFASLSTPMINKSGIKDMFGKSCALLPYGVDTTVYCPISEEEKIKLRKELGLNPIGKYVCFVGGIMERKGVDVLVDAFRIVEKQLPDVYLLLVGRDKYVQEGFNDPYYHQFQRFVDNLKNSINTDDLSTKIIFTGLSDHVDAYLKVSNVFVLPSRREGFGAVIIEAMSVGLPCIVSEMDGISSDIISNDIDGYIIKGFEREKYANRIIALLQDKELVEEIRLRARRTIEERYTLPFIADKYLTFYEHLLQF